MERLPEDNILRVYLVKAHYVTDVEAEKEEITTNTTVKWVNVAIHSMNLRYTAVMHVCAARIARTFDTLKCGVSANGLKSHLERIHHE